MARSDIRKHILRLASRLTGMAADEVQGFTTKQAGVACWKMAKEGLLFKAELPRSNGISRRYFTNPGLRDALVERARSRPAAPTVSTAHERRVANWAPGTPAIETERTVYTQCPAFEPPYQRQLPTLSYGGNQRGRVYLGSAG